MPKTTSTLAVDEMVRAILTGPDYHMLPKERPLFDPATRRMLFEWLGWLATPLMFLHGVSPLLYYGVVALVVVAVVALIWRMVRMFLLAMDPLDAIADLGPEQRDPTPGEFEERAVSLAQAGRLDEALRCLVAAAILCIEPEASRRRRGATNRTYVRRHQHSPIAPHLTLLVEAFDQAWYGGRRLTVEDYAACSQAYQALRCATVRAGK